METDLLKRVKTEQRALTPWVRLEHFSLSERTGEISRLSFSLKIDLQEALQAWLESSGREGRAQFRLGGGDKRIGVAAGVKTDAGPSWFFVQWILVPGIAALRLKPEFFLPFGPTWIAPEKLFGAVTTAVGPFGIEFVNALSANVRLDASFNTLLERAIGQQLAGPVAPARIDASLEGAGLVVTSEGIPPSFKEGSEGAEGHLPPLEVEADTSAFARTLDDAILEMHWSQVHNLVRSRGAEKTHAARGLLAMVLHGEPLEDKDLMVARRLAHRGEVQAICSLLAWYQKEGRALQASHWYHRLEQAAEGLDAAARWAIAGAVREYRCSLAGRSSDVIVPEAPVGSETVQSEAVQSETVQSETVRSGDVVVPDAPVLSETSRPETSRPGEVILPDDSVRSETHASEPVPSDEGSWGGGIGDPLLEAIASGCLTDGLLARTVEMYESRQDWKGLLALLGEGLEIAGSGADKKQLHHELARLKSLLGVPSRAVAHYEAILEEESEDRVAREFLRAYYTEQGMLEARIRLEARAARGKPGAVRVLLELATEAGDAKLSDLERELLLEAFWLEPTDRDLLTRLTALLEKGDAWEPLIDVWRCFMARCDSVPERLDAGLRIAGWLRRKGELEGAGRLYENLLRIKPGWRQAIDGLMKNLEEREDWAGVVRLLEEQSRQERGARRLDILLRLADIRAERLDDPEAIEGWHQEVLAGGELEPDVIKTVARWLEARGEWVFLIDFLEAHLEGIREPDIRRDLLSFLGDLYLVRVNDPARAQICFKRAESTL